MSKLKKRLGERDLRTLGGNFCVDLMQRVAQELNILSCWICEGGQITEQWPWRGEGLKPDQLVIWNRTHKSRDN